MLKSKPFNDASIENDPSEYNNNNKVTPKNKISWFFKCLISFALLMILLIFVLLIVTFVIIPVVFKYSIDFQRLIIFMPKDTTQEEFQYLHNFEDGIRNFYVTIDVDERITLGVLHLLPTSLISESIKNENFSFACALARADYPVLLHFHGNGGNRFYNMAGYLRLREYFHVLGFDYQSYGDSTKSELTELGLVEASIELYKWLMTQTAPNNIYVWGHSLGGAIAAHTLARLGNEDIIPMGLVLEATFPSLREEVEQYSLAKIFKWLPWFEFTVQEGLQSNGFIFNTTSYVCRVDCPIMILHAEDDVFIPYFLAEKLNDTVVNKRNHTTQGNVTFHLIPAMYHCNHWSIVEVPELTEYISDYIMDCEVYHNMNKNQNKTKTTKTISTTYGPTSLQNTSESIYRYNKIDASIVF